MTIFGSLLLATALLSSAVAEPETSERHKRQVSSSCQTVFYLNPYKHESEVYDSLARCPRDPGLMKYPNSVQWTIDVYNMASYTGDYYLNVVYDIDIESQPSCEWDSLTFGGYNLPPRVVICGEQTGAFSVRIRSDKTSYHIAFSSDSIINERGFQLNISLSLSPDFDPDVHPQYTEPVNSFDSIYIEPSNYSSDSYPGYSSSYNGYYDYSSGNSNDWSSDGYGYSSAYYPDYSSSYDYYWPGYGSSSSYDNYWSSNDYGYSSSYDNYWPGYGSSSSYDNYWSSNDYGYSSSYDNYWPSNNYGYSSSYDNYWPSSDYGYSSSYDNYWPSSYYGYSSSYDNWNSYDQGYSTDYYGTPGGYNGGNGGISSGEERASLLQSLKTELRELEDAVKETQQSLADLEQNYHNANNNPNNNF